jgi:hypothetical protein
MMADLAAPKRFLAELGYLMVWTVIERGERNFDHFSPWKTPTRTSPS